MSINAIVDKMIGERSNEEFVEHTSLIDSQIVCDLMKSPVCQITRMIICRVESIATDKSDSIRKDTSTDGICWSNPNSWIHGFLCILADQSWVKLHEIRMIKQSFELGC